MSGYWSGTAEEITELSPFRQEYAILANMDEPIIAKIETILARLRPAFQRDRGDIEFVRWLPDTGVVEVRLHGMCRGCGMAEFTLKMGVEDSLKEELPEVVEVRRVE